MNNNPTVIQGGMGTGVSDWKLARAVSQTGQLGVVSGTAIDVIIARRLQMGDEGGHVRRALEHFPIKDVAQRIIERYFIEGGKADTEKFKAKPILSDKPNKHLEELIVASNFVEVYLAKEGHDGLVGINFLEKIQLPTLASIYGAMLAGVDYVLMGAGIPKAIPGYLDGFAIGKSAKMELFVEGADVDDHYTITFDPAAFFGGDAPQLKRPKFLAIISSATLASMLARKASGKVDGFVVEMSTAGGHNAPPRGRMQLTPDGEPIYSKRDDADLKAIAKIGLPFWVAGSCASPEKVALAVNEGGSGIQAGTIFAYCDESGLRSDYKQKVLKQIKFAEPNVFTDPLASPTGFPFKVAQVEGTLSEDSVYEGRKRLCDLGYLRHAYKKADGSLGWRCPAEPVADYIKKGGNESDTACRKCLCNGLLAAINLGQTYADGTVEAPILTTGNDLQVIKTMLQPNAESYTAADVIDYLLQDVVTLKDKKTG